MNRHSSDKKIDVVVPIYNGQRYIKRIISRLEVCQENMDRTISICLILVNDNPEDVFCEMYWSEKIDIIVIETGVNQGIHGARVNGLLHCTGEYVLFLDQDDWISDNYLASQLKRLEVSKADAVVCRAKENGREVYNETTPFTKTIDYQNMISMGNTIVSPGQVLIRKAAIPDIWKYNILKNNGVDDWFLWICMMQRGCHFVLNEEILFEHMIEGENLSWNSRKMLLSEQEMLKIIKATAILDETRLEEIDSLIDAEQQRYIGFLEKYRRLFFIYDKWMSLESHKGCISEYLYKQKIREVAVYGMGYIGKQLVNRLKDTNILIDGAIDRNAGFIEATVPIVRFEEFDKKPDLIIVTVLEHAEEIIKDIEKQINLPAVSICKLLENWEQGGWIQHGCSEHRTDDR